MCRLFESSAENLLIGQIVGEIRNVREFLCES